MVNKTWVGSALLLVVLTASFYILIPDKIRIDFQEAKTIFSVWEEDKFEYTLKKVVC